jgi:hypothetical protein
VSSYYREVWFRSVNALIGGEDFFYAKTTELPFLKSWASHELYRLKYVLTAGFSILFMGLTALGLKWSFKSNLPFQISLGIYSLLLLTAGISIVIALILNQFSDLYPFLRSLVGIIHNPLLFIILSAGEKAFQVVRN